MYTCTKDMLIPVSTKEYRIQAIWKNTECQLKLTNITQDTLYLQKIAVLEMAMPFQPDTAVYGEGYNKLCQYGGTVRDVKMTGSHGDAGHYKLPIPDGYQQVYNMVRFAPEKGKKLMLGFSSCNRFSGEFWFDEKILQVILNLEGIALAPGETVVLENLFIKEGQQQELDESFASAIRSHHPMLQTPKIPTGWCSWPVYGPEVTAQNIYDVLEAIREKELDLKYIQLDDGYQPYMGDWLSATEAFDGGIEKLCLDIKKQGFEPAIWVAPFIAEKGSELFGAHPDWFVKDEDGQPLPSDRVSFGGWRCGPWYMLDGTHPGARQYLTHVFKTMREQWGVKYFKLDANMWGALPFGVRFEKNRTSVEAYRMGMEAILKGAGYDSFLLGCNAPMWPSLGLVHGMRVTNDTTRSFERFTALANECFARNWQHNKLWINDPDTVLQRNRKRVVVDPAGQKNKISRWLEQKEFLYNATYVLASGGMVLSGDNITEFTKENEEDLKKLLPPTGKAAVFDTDDYSVGRIELDGEQILCIFNEDASPHEFSIHIPKESEVINFWTGERFEMGKCVPQTVCLEGHSAMALRVMSSL